MATINNPFGAAGILTIAATGTTAATISNQVTYVASKTTLTGNATLNLTLSSELKAGAMLHLEVATTATETFTFDTEKLVLSTGDLITATANFDSRLEVTVSSFRVS